MFSKEKHVQQGEQTAGSMEEASAARPPTRKDISSKERCAGVLCIACHVFRLHVCLRVARDMA
jgi:hypothetical protein